VLANNKSVHWHFFVIEKGMWMIVDNNQMSLRGRRMDMLGRYVIAGG
jgi:hypothetical protein